MAVRQVVVREYIVLFAWVTDRYVFYIVYSTEKNGDKYLQPTMGYVPFILKNQLRYGYVVLNIYEKKNTSILVKRKACESLNNFQTF